MTLEEIKQILPTLPESAGCYKYYNKEGVVIYVGKAKNLRRRVSSYFHKEHLDAKTRMLVRQIERIEYIVVETEFDALLLENALIKEHQPRYNVLLKDGKTYPEIIITRERFPRVFVARRAPRDGSQRFGPYPSVQMAHATLAMLKDIFPIRTCRLDLSREKVQQGRYKECLQYHIKKCKAPCVAWQEEEDYNANMREVANLLKGNMQSVIELYQEEMQALSAELRFEEAQIYKERLEQLEQYQVKHTVAPHHIHNVDVFSFERDDSVIYVNYLHISQGMVNRAQTLEYKLRLGEEDNELLASTIMELRRRFDSRAKEIILPFELGWDIEGASVTIPKIGDKKKLLELSERNVKQYKLDKYKQAERLNPDQRMMQTLTELKDILALPELPIQIDCFDNAHIQGGSPVSACVVFKRAKASKKDYRKYHLRSLETQGDDYAAMREVIRRRYEKLREEPEKLPNLIIADGGKGQMNAVREVLLDLGLTIPVAGMVKDDKHRSRELLFGSPIKAIPLKHNSTSFRLLESIQAEVHRFAINFHRDVRSKGQVASRLDYIKGVGEKTKALLLQEFKSVKRITEASEEDLAKLVGKAKAKLIFNTLH